MKIKSKIRILILTVIGLAPSFKLSVLDQNSVAVVDAVRVEGTTYTLTGGLPTGDYTLGSGGL